MNSENDNKVILGLLAADRNVILFRKDLRKIAGTVTATILLQQMHFRAEHHGYKPFYKFRGPCEHAKYRPGDSWAEELSFSVDEFDTALKHIGTKIRQGDSKKDIFNVDPNAPMAEKAKRLVIYWTDSDRVTWYHFNQELFVQLVKSIYLDNGEGQPAKLNGKANLPKKMGDDPLANKTEDNRLPSNQPNSSYPFYRDHYTDHTETTQRGDTASPAPASIPDPEPTPNSPSFNPLEGSDLEQLTRAGQRKRNQPTRRTGPASAIRALVDECGMPLATLTAFVDELASIHGTSALINAGEDDRELRNLQDMAITLWKMSEHYRTVAKVRTLGELWRKDKPTFGPPQGNQFLKFASQQLETKGTQYDDHRSPETGIDYDALARENEQWMEAHFNAGREAGSTGAVGAAVDGQLGLFSAGHGPGQPGGT
jgi:hypothetical protein